jgi:prolyl 4-hydroxylase
MNAVTELEARAEAGEPDAQFALARSLLSDPQATQDHFYRAVELVDAASSASFGEATEMRALFEATGAGRIQSGDSAFDTLQLAAQQGSVRAGQQLLALAHREAVTQLAEAPDSDFWAEIRNAISVERLMHHGERRSLCDSPRIRVIDGFASPSECAWLIERARSRLKAALVFDRQGNQVADQSRTNKGAEFQLPDMDVVLEVIRARISAATRIPVPVFEQTQVLHYEVGQEFKRHLDFLEPGNPKHQEQLRSHGQRIATFLIYLNEDFEGGETEFSQVGIRYRGKTGDALFWANVDNAGKPEPLTLHAGLPPSSGEKWILSQWIRDRAPPAR